MEKEKIKVEEDQILKFYDEFGSKNFQLQTKTLTELGSKTLDLYFRSLELVIPIITSIGVIAGFGFTAYLYIQSKTIFFLGEGILVYGILNGLLWLQKIYKKEYDSIDNFTKSLQNHFDLRNNAFIKVYNQLISENHEILKEDFLELQKIDNNMIKIFKKNGNQPTLQIYSKTTYYCFIMGVIILFSSFFIYNIQHYICWIINFFLYIK